MATSKKKKPLLHIITPVYNEAENFPNLYAQVKEHIKTPHKLVVVYDFDEDTTVPVVKRLMKKDTSIVLHKNNRGRGALNALLSGFDYVESGPLLTIMADLCDDVRDVDIMYQKYLEGADIVVGSRYVKGGKQLGGPLLKRTLSRSAGLSLRWIRRFPVHDPTNNFKLYTKETLNSITIESTGGFEIGMEITVKAFKQNRKIVEIPTTWRDRTAGEAQFKLWQWLPSYIKWYLYAYR